MSSFKVLATALLSFTATASAFKQLNPIQQLANRNPYYGGYALPESNLGCPANTETCLDSFCCPVGTWCGPSSNGAYCCPTNEDCFTQVNDLPTCADPSWTLFEDVYPWCCADGQIGIGGQICADPAVSYSAGDYAETQTQANTAEPPATRSSVSVAGSAATTTAGSGSGSAATTTKGTTTATSTATSASSSAPAATTKASAGSNLSLGWEMLASLLAVGVIVGLM